LFIADLVGGFNPSEKYESQLELLFLIWKNNLNVPNHQPVMLDIRNKQALHLHQGLPSFSGQPTVLAPWILPVTYRNNQQMVGYIVV
jgi:hypothetical protein